MALWDPGQIWQKGSVGMGWGWGVTAEICPGPFNNGMGLGANLVLLREQVQRQGVPALTSGHRWSKGGKEAL